jgi:gamma-glutamyltranspeptidase/glutathione hydrolase
VASEHPLASFIGSKVLESGGNAVDAAVAVSATLSVTLPHLGGLGGDFFALVMQPSGKVRFFNGSGYSPKKASLEDIRSLGYDEMPSDGPLSPVVPGMVDGLRMMWEALGTAEWKDLILPAAKIAKEGFVVTRSLSTAITSSIEKLSNDKGSRITYLAGGKPPREGDLIKFPGLSKALEEIAENPRSFYEGEIARKISEYVQKAGGLLDLEDFKEFKAVEGNPISISYKGLIVYEMPPNTQGITTLHILKMLEGYEPVSGGSRSHERILKYLEVFLKAYAVRDMFVTDPARMQVSVEELLRMDLDVTNVRYGNQFLGGDTTFFSVIDSDGCVVAGIQSLFYPFGSFVTEPYYGITLNARASSFSLDPRNINRLEPRKRPLHTLSAMLVKDDARGEVKSIGLSGGHFRPQLHAEIFTNIVDYGMHPQEAIEHPRFVWHPGRKDVGLEEGYEMPSLEEYRFSLKPYPSRLGVAALTEVRSNGVRGAYCDIRGDGLPAGLP